MLEDFQNFSMERCKALILEYQKDKKEEQFALLLARFDKYLLHVIYELRSRWKYLQSEELQELYHTSILGFHKGLIAFKPHVPVTMIIPVLKAYIKSEMVINYSYKGKEICFEQVPETDPQTAVENNMSALLVLSSIAKRKDLSQKEKDLIQMRFGEELSVKEIAMKYGVTRGAIYQKLNKILKKIRKGIAE